MATNSKLRSQVISFSLIDVLYKEVEEYEGDFGERKLPHGISIIGPILNLMKREGKTSSKNNSLWKACGKVAHEIHDMWVYTGNVYPKHVQNIRKKW